MIGVGVDILNIERLSHLDGKLDDPFFRRSFTERERTEDPGNHSRLAFFAARFAAKEAVFKALGTTPGAVRLSDIEICRDASGIPWPTLRGGAADAAAKAGITSIHLSLSYEKDYVVAFAVAE
ncbi:MAG: holo-ACP synthase [Clostridiales Family XIII bacterium]|jgi:phosphopantetheine--protein transferase-like protein|nr:holo-ACP synthase [Clostridiales Family XIII bacterium]